jgi:hypothetical protein
LQAVAKLAARQVRSTDFAVTTLLLWIDTFLFHLYQEMGNALIHEYRMKMRIDLRSSERHIPVSRHADEGNSYRAPGSKLCSRSEPMDRRN